MLVLTRRRRPERRLRPSQLRLALPHPPREQRLRSRAELRQEVVRALAGRVAVVVQVAGPARTIISLEMI